MSVPDDIRRQIDARLSELEPLVAEYNDLRAMLGLGPKSGRRYHSSIERQSQIMALVRENPGIRVKDLADRLKVSVPRIVQVLNDLERAGDVERTPDGLRPSS